MRKVQDTTPQNPPSLVFSHESDVNGSGPDRSTRRGLLFGLTLAGLGVTVGPAMAHPSKQEKNRVTLLLRRKNAVIRDQAEELRTLKLRLRSIEERASLDLASQLQAMTDEERLEVAASLGRMFAGPDYRVSRYESEYVRSYEVTWTKPLEVS